MHGRSLQDRRGGEERAPAEERAASRGAETLLELQRTAGNAAVSRALLMRRDRGPLAAEQAPRLPGDIDFGGWMSEENPIRFNPEFWTLRYYLIREIADADSQGPDRLSFPTWDDATDYMDDNPGWNPTKLVIRFRPRGDAHAALEDLFDADSADEYAFDCLIAAVLVQFQALHRQFLADSSLGDERARIAAFNARYGRHVFRTEGADVSRLAPGLGLEETDIGEDIPLARLREGAGRLRRGDLVSIENPYMPPGHAFIRENATYLGNLRFHGHPLGTFDTAQYAAALIDMGVGYLPGVTGTREWLLERSFVQQLVWRPPAGRARGRGFQMTGAAQGGSD
jgi:hypothetical protein